MTQITDADREATQALRVLLADLSGFWFKGDDASALCTALARHRIEAEERLARTLVPMEERVFGPKRRALRSGASVDLDGTSAAA